VKTYYLPCYCQYTDYWQELCYTYGGNILDRTNTLTFGDFKYETLTKIPELRTMSHSFADLCEIRAQEFADIAERDNCSINLMWSGGIDSTVAIVSLLKNPIARKRLHVLMSQKSINEYPLFFSKYIEGKVRFSLVKDPKKLLDYQDVNITGEIGDQLFGSAAFFDANNKGKLYANPKDYYPAEFIELMEPQIVHAPYELKEVKDYMWWINFSMKYQNVQLRIYPTILMPYGKLSHYFDTEEFQLWSMTNPDKKVRDTIASYKWPAKDYIYEFTGDADYRDNKLKVGSLQIGALKCSIDTDFVYDIC